MITLVDVHKAFGSQPVLRGVSLEVPKGLITIIIGRSGAGKSVMLKHIIGLVQPDQGRILVDGVDIAQLRGQAQDALRQRFGVLFQGGALFDSMDVFDNVAFPLREKTRMGEGEIRDKVLERLRQVDLLGMERKFPAELSGGMRKRAALARALIMDPEIVLFDEPTTGLDPILVTGIHRLIATMHARFGFTGVVVSHDVPHVFT
ncbi:MAG: ATP-binding cassette domain-containing protein, partial [Deltaproteobacteria bacterium]|nr:ATP-binding cassette domain-containing protein [Deltaproteobacteria bacterium]